MKIYKIIIFNIILLIFLQNLFAEELTNKDDFIRNYDISIGGAYSQFIGLSSITYQAANILQISIPFSFSYNPFKYFGIGFLYSPGINFVLSNKYLTVLRFIDFSNYLRVINKIGDISNIYFLLEYGGVMIRRLSLSDILYNQHPFLYKNHLLGGSSIFIGFEKKTKERFLFTFGNKIDFLFGSVEIHSIDYTETTTSFGNLKISDGVWNNMFVYNISIGLECRWRFNINKEIRYSRY